MKKEEQWMYGLTYEKKRREKKDRVGESSFKCLNLTGVQPQVKCKHRRSEI